MTRKVRRAAIFAALVFAATSLALFGFFVIRSRDRAEEVRSVNIPGTQWRMVVEEHVNHTAGVLQIYYLIGMKGAGSATFVTGPVWVQATGDVRLNTMLATWENGKGRVVLPGFCVLEATVWQESELRIEKLGAGWDAH